MQPVISAQHDDYRRGATELWHIPRIGNGQPLCGASISGRVRKSKMQVPNCSSCVNCDKPWGVKDELRDCMIELHEGKRLSVNDKRWRYQISQLIRYDYVKTVGEVELRLTMRGKVILKDLLSPAPWWDRKTRALHARPPLKATTRCGLKLAEIFTTWDLKRLADKARERADNTITCLECLGTRQ